MKIFYSVVIVVYFLCIGCSSKSFNTSIKMEVIPAKDKEIFGMELSFQGFYRSEYFQTKAKIDRKGNVEFFIDTTNEITGFFSVEDPMYNDWQGAKLIHPIVVISPNKVNDIGRVYIGELIILTKKERIMYWDDNPNLNVCYQIIMSTETTIDDNKKVIQGKTVKTINMNNEMIVDLDSIDDINIINEDEYIRYLGTKYQIIGESPNGKMYAKIRSYIWDEKIGDIVFISESNPVYL